MKGREGWWGAHGQPNLALGWGLQAVAPSDPETCPLHAGLRQGLICMYLHLHEHASNFEEFCVFNRCKWPSGFPSLGPGWHSSGAGEADGTFPGPGGWPGLLRATAVGGGGAGGGQLLTDLARDLGVTPGGLGLWPWGCVAVGPGIRPSCLRARPAVALPGCCSQAQNLGQAGAERQGRPVGPQRPRAGP